MKFLPTSLQRLQFKKLIDSLGDRRSEEQSFASMVLFTKNGGTRLVQVRALEGEFPYYGSLETSPESAGISFRSKQQAAPKDEDSAAGREGERRLNTPTRRP